MRNEEIERLLGGYATDTLTAVERQTLFDAALEDQQLFDALQDEEALRDLLSDTEARNEIGRALKAEPSKTGRLKSGWVWGLAGGLAAALATLAILAVIQPWRAPLQIPNQPRKDYAQALVPAKQETKPRAAQVVRRKTAMIEAPVMVAGKAPLRAEEASKAFAVDQSAASANSPAVPAISSRQQDRFPTANAAAYVTADQKAVDRLSISLVRGEAVLASGDPVEEGEAIRFRVQTPLGGALTLFERKKGHEFERSGVPVVLQPGQQATIPAEPISIHGERSFRFDLTAPDRVAASTELTVVPGKPVFRR